MAMLNYQSPTSEVEGLRCENTTLRSENSTLRGENTSFKGRIIELEATIAKLREALERARRQGKRQAAPFSRGQPKTHPKTPGRRPAPHYGSQANRAVPEHIDEFYDVPLPDHCPCGGHVEEMHVDQQYQTEIPRRAIHRQFDIHIGRCQDCRRRIQGRHPLQTSDALGAAEAQLGPVAQAAIVWFNKHAGLSHGKIARCFADLFGISICRATSVRTVLRAGRRCESTYQALRQQARRDPWAVPDETGWKVGGRRHWLHAVVTKNATVYEVAPTRSSEVAEGILGKDYAGLLVHDGWAPYDNFGEADHQGCLAHITRRCEEILETANRGAVRFPCAVLAMMREALAVRDMTASFPAGERRTHRADAAEELRDRLEKLVRPAKTNAVNEKLSVHLWNHLDEWFTFLELDHEDATNWRAEQAIRPAVVNRKVWGGNRTDNGARAQSVLMSVVETCRKQLRNALAFIADSLRGGAPALMPLGP
jgi:transposase